MKKTLVFILMVLITIGSIIVIGAYQDVERDSSRSSDRKVTTSYRGGDSDKPTVVASNTNTPTPTKKAVKKATATPTKKPTATPTKKPTKKPTATPTKQPTKRPTATPTRKPVITQTVDKRVANYQGTKTDYKAKKISWTGEKGNKYTITINIDMNVYRYYKSLDRYYGAENYISKYIKDKYNKALLDSVIASFRSLQKKNNMSDRQIIEELINFVQQGIVYQYDIEGTGQKEYPKYPIETLTEGKGDCEDSAMLLCGLIYCYGYGSCLIELPGHLAVGALCSNSEKGTYYNYNGKRYYYLESTGSGWNIGQIPDDYKNTTAKLYVK